MIDSATVQRIKDTADIVEVVSDYVHLTRRGANYIGLCPFHNERTPSFSVSKSRNFCHCFSCHKGGSPVNFIMEKEGISYHDALLHLAKKYGIKVEERELSDEERAEATEREGLLIAAERAMRQMEADLTGTQEGREVGLTYFVSRGITEEAIKAFHLGYAIDSGNHLTPIMQREGYDLDTLTKLGVTGKSQSGNLYDKFRGRVVFPIMNSSGKTVGFGARDLKGGNAKYINSPESVLYRKSHELYGLNQAKSAITKEDRCYLVEGYMDVISMWQTGMRNVVASSGTALTDGQIALIHRFTENITLLYDGDSAGIHAALRGIDMLLLHKMKVSVLLLPDGHDPDSFARNHTPEEFREYVKANETDIIRFKIQVLLENSDGSTQSRANAVNSVVNSIACIHDDVARSLYIAECSRMMGVPEASVATAVEKAVFAIREQQKRERGRKEIDHIPPSPSRPEDQNAVPTESSVETGESSGESSSADNGSDALAVTIERTGMRKSFPLRPVERQMISDLIRYGFLPFREPKQAEAHNSPEGKNPEEEQTEETYTNLDFICVELEADSLEFSVPEYRKAFDLLNDLLEDYFRKADEHNLKLEDELREEQRKGFEEIGSKDLGIKDIEREEKILASKLDEWREKAMFDFARFFPGDIMASHPDKEIRSLANECINERHILSGLFSKNTPPPTVTDISARVIRSLTEWKSEVINLRYQELQQRLQSISGEDSEEEMKVMMELAKVARLRSKIANITGERVVSPQRL